MAPGGRDAYGMKSGGGAAPFDVLPARCLCRMRTCHGGAAGEAKQAFTKACMTGLSSSNTLCSSKKADGSGTSTAPPPWHAALGRGRLQPPWLPSNRADLTATPTSNGSEVRQPVAALAAYLSPRDRYSSQQGAGCSLRAIGIGPLQRQVRGPQQRCAAASKSCKGRGARAAAPPARWRRCAIE